MEFLYGFLTDSLKINHKTDELEKSLSKFVRFFDDCV